MTREKIYTRAGDDGTTGLFYGGRVGKDSALPRAYGAVDEAQAILGLVRAEAGKGTELDDMLGEVGGSCSFDNMIKMFQTKMAGGEQS